MNVLRLLFDKFTIALLGVVLMASLLPCTGATATFFGGLTTFAIALLFFMHGAKLSRAEIRAGAGHWRLHGLVFLLTFVMFPLLGLAMRPLAVPLIGVDLYLGLLYLCALPATVQSAIAFTSLARGNVSAAICSAAASSLLGVFLTPLLVLLLIGAQGQHVGFDAVGKIVLQLLVPFIAGHLARRWIGGWVAGHRARLRLLDQGSILLVVYTAFSHAVISGLWQSVPLWALVALTMLCAMLLAVVLLITTFAARRCGFDIADRITIVFAASKKSLATGVPMAQILFTGGAVGTFILPLMLFHQIQLMVCAVLAQRYAQRADAPGQAAVINDAPPVCREATSDPA